METDQSWLKSIITQSLQFLGLDYIDMYLIHHPFGVKSKGLLNESYPGIFQG